MAEGKILTGVRLHGRLFRPGVASDAKELNEYLSPEDAKRLEEQGVIEGIKGTSQKAEKEADPKLTQALRARHLTVTNDEASPRPEGITKDDDGEPERPEENIGGGLITLSGAKIGGTKAPSETASEKKVAGPWEKKE